MTTAASSAREPTSSLSVIETAATTGDVSQTQRYQTIVAGSYTSLASHEISLVPIASPFAAASSGAVATTNQRAPSLKRPAFIGAAAGLCAAAFVTIIAVVLLFRRDRRLTRSAKLVQLAWPRNVNSFGYASPGGLQQSGIAGADDADGLPGYGARDPALGASLFRTYARTSDILTPARTPATAAPSSRCRRYTCSQSHGASTHPGDM